jgi:hypothetical protein
MAGRPGPLRFFAGIVSCSQSVVRRILGAVALDEAGQHGQQAEGSISSERECDGLRRPTPRCLISVVHLPSRSRRTTCSGLSCDPAPRLYLTPPPPSAQLPFGAFISRGKWSRSGRHPFTAAKPPTGSCTSRSGLLGNNLLRFAAREHPVVHNTFSAAAAFRAVHHRTSSFRGSPGPRQGLLLQLEALVHVLSF